MESTRNIKVSFQEKAWPDKIWKPEVSSDKNMPNALQMNH